MKGQFVFLAAFLFALSEVRAQQCFACASVHSVTGKVEVVTEVPGMQTCDSPLEMDCSLQGGCFTGSYDYVFDVEGDGQGTVHMVQTGCDARRDGCVSGRELEQLLSTRSALINALVPDVRATFVSGTGEECFCTTDLCNTPPADSTPAPPSGNTTPTGSAAAWKSSISTLLFSLIVSLASKV